MTDKYREGLITLNKWYSEGLLYQSMYAAKSKDLKALMNPTDGVETVGIIVDHSSLTYIDGAETMYDYDPLPLLGYAVHNAQAFNKRCYITTDCQYPDDAWRLLMAMNSDEGSKRGYYGVKGRDWDDADPGQKSALGMDAEIKIINYVWGNNKNELWNQVNFILFYSENEKTQIAGGEDAWGNVRVRKMADFYYAFEAAAEKNNPKYVVHSLIYSTEEKEKTADIRSNCSDAITTAQTSFITGDDQKDPANDADWQEYLNLLKSLGIDTWRDQAQRLYDAQQRK